MPRIFQNSGVKIFYFCLEIIPTVAKTACDMCTTEQKKELKKHLDYIKQNRPDEWADLIGKFDPTKENLEKFLAAVPE